MVQSKEFQQVDGRVLLSCEHWRKRCDAVQEEGTLTHIVIGKFSNSWSLNSFHRPNEMEHNIDCPGNVYDQLEESDLLLEFGEDYSERRHDGIVPRKNIDYEGYELPRWFLLVDEVPLDFSVNVIWHVVIDLRREAQIA